MGSKIEARVGNTDPMKYTEYSRNIGKTGRVCSGEGCRVSAPFVNGYYLVGRRRVRVWVCARHRDGYATKLLPTPKHIQAALDAEQEHYAKMRRIDKATPRVPSESIQAMASSGHGPSLPFDRVAAWRWNGF